MQAGREVVKIQMQVIGQRGQIFVKTDCGCQYFYFTIDSKISPQPPMLVDHKDGYHF